MSEPSKLNVHLYPSPIIVESRMMRIARSLSGAGLFSEIHLVGTMRSGLSRDEIVESSIRIRRLGPVQDGAGQLAKIVYFAVWMVLVVFRYIRQPVTVLNAHSLTTLPLAALLKAVTGAKLVYDTHELETETTNLSGFRKSLSKKLERFLMKYCDHCFFVGAEIEKWYRTEYPGISSDVIFNYPNAISVPPDNYLRKKFSVPDGVPTFIYLGLLSHGRGIGQVLEAFESLQDTAHVILIGTGPLEEEIRRWSQKCRNIHFHEAVPPREVVRTAASADYGLSMIEPSSLSYEMCMPNKVFEYLQAGLPVLVSPRIEQARLVRVSGVGYVAEDVSPQSVCQGVAALMAVDQNLLRDNVKKTQIRFTWEAQEPKLLAPYYKLADPKLTRQQPA